jgi:hypothetical protein
VILKKFLFLILQLTITFYSFGQIKSITSSSAKTTFYQEAFTALVIKSQTDLGSAVSVVLDSDTLQVPFDPDAPSFTYFISLPRPYQSAQVQVLTDAQVEINYINSGATPSIAARNHRLTQNSCSFEFNPITQNEWRAGLAAPTYSRSFTQVKHVVVHHAAGSNTNMNFTQVVRDIYIYHTQSNKWSDIGYNYLIAQNGDIYKGRDPDAGEQDNVLGAHFCGQNAGTMGICLLGNYETAIPTAETWQSLETLVAFKLDKEQLDPLQNYPHSFGNIGSIVGHRDGCSTSCPGENTYSQLATLKQTIAQRLNDCDPVVNYSLNFSVNDSLVIAGEQIIFSNQSTGYDEYDWVFEGGGAIEIYLNNSAKVIYFLPGAYDVSLIGISSTKRDTLKKEMLIHVKGKPTMYPNPAVSQGTISISSEMDLEAIQLSGISGAAQQLKALSVNQFQLPYLRSGIYFLRFKTDGKWFTKRLLIQ